MKLLNFTIIKLTTCLIAGILLGYYFNIQLITSIYISTCLLTVLLLLYLIANKQFTRTIWFGITALITTVSIGVLTINFSSPKNDANHYSNQNSIAKGELNTITCRIRETLKPGKYHDKYVVDILELNNQKVSGKLLLNIEKDSVDSALHVDDIIISKTQFKDLNTPLNPHQFNYKKHLEKQYIYHQLYLNTASIVKAETSNQTLFGLADGIRRHINTKLKPYHFKPDQLAIINALLLGQRQDITKEVYTTYTNAGAIHILAVSGLHVGIVLLILSFILKPLEYLKYGKPIKTILLVCMLWSFALIAGLSPSVTRAVTMFSIITIARNLKRPTNIYNTLAISMFVILLFKPLFIFDVGFQLSYLAVFAIVTLDPYFYKLWQPKNKIINFYWHTFTVTASAQLGIIPVSLYYFHQFPGLFFVSNLVIIPFLGLILGLGMLLILLAVTNLLPQFFAEFYGNIITFLNSFVEWVSNQGVFILKDISFSLLSIFTTYLLGIAIFKLTTKRSYNTLVFLLTSVLIIQALLIYGKLNTASNEFIVFHKSRSSLIGNTTKNKTLIAHDFDSLTTYKNNIVRDYTVGNHIKEVREDSLRDLYKLNNKLMLIVDSLGIYSISNINPDYVLLRQSPKVNLNRLIDALKPKYIIADGSNYKSYVNRWELICKKRKLPFHQTGKKGAFIIKY